MVTTRRAINEMTGDAQCLYGGVCNLALFSGEGSTQERAGSVSSCDFRESQPPPVTPATVCPVGRKEALIGRIYFSVLESTI